MQAIVDKIRMDGKVAVITGGHSGIGRGISEAFAQAGANLVIVGRREALGRAVAQEIAHTHGVQTVFVTADVTHDDDRKRIVREALEVFGRIDVLVNNAGMTFEAGAEDITYADWRRVMDLNLDALFFLSQEAGRVMIAQGGGSIVNISSNSDRVAQTPQRQAVYNASKAGVDMVTKCLAYEWAKHNIRVNAVAPGYIKSDIWPQGVREDGKKWHEVWLEMIPAGRFGLPEEIGGLVLFAASDMCAFMTGSILLADGGYTVL